MWKWCRPFAWVQCDETCTEACRRNPRSNATRLHLAGVHGVPRWGAVTHPGPLHGLLHPSMLHPLSHVGRQAIQQRYQWPWPVPEPWGLPARRGLGVGAVARCRHRRAWPATPNRCRGTPGTCRACAGSRHSALAVTAGGRWVQARWFSVTGVGVVHIFLRRGGVPISIPVRLGGWRLVPPALPRAAAPAERCLRF